jgi:hypothetical protein
MQAVSDGEGRASGLLGHEDSVRKKGTPRESELIRGHLEEPRARSRDRNVSVRQRVIGEDDRSTSVFLGAQDIPFKRHL